MGNLLYSDYRGLIYISRIRTIRPYESSNQSVDPLDVTIDDLHVTAILVCEGENAFPFLVSYDQNLHSDRYPVAPPSPSSPTWLTHGSSEEYAIRSYPVLPERAQSEENATMAVAVQVRLRELRFLFRFRLVFV